MEIGVIWLQLRDLNGNISPVMQIPVAFSSYEQVPNLLGMKGLLEYAKILIDPFRGFYSMKFPV